METIPLAFSLLITSYVVVVKLILLNTFLQAVYLQYRRRTMRMVKDLEGKAYEEQLRSLVFFIFPWIDNCLFFFPLREVLFI